MGTTPIDALIFTLVFATGATLCLVVIYYLTLPEKISLQGFKMIKTKKNDKKYNNPGCKCCKYKYAYQSLMGYEQVCKFSATKQYNHDGEFFIYTKCIELNNNLECTNFKPNLFTKIFRNKLLEGYLND